VIDLRRGSGAARVTATSAAQPTPLVIDNEAGDAATAGGDAPSAVESETNPPAWLEEERVGPPYQAGGRWYVPTPEPGYEQTGTASWYGNEFHGQRTASGEEFDQHALSAAHPTLPMPSLVQVTNLENGREIIVRVNDRGPFVGGRVLDVSRAAAEALGFQSAGHARVHVRYLGPAPRRVAADGAAASSALAEAEQVAEEGPSSLLPPTPVSTPAVLAGGVVEEVDYQAPVSTGRYFVQVGAYSDLGNAHRVRDAVTAAGPVVVDVRETGSGAELFRVRVGPWANREEAEAARRQLASLGYGESIVAAP
jgi:rare lipoprotein A